MAGLLQQEYGNTQLPEIMQQIMSPTTVVERAFDWIERQKQQEMRRKWNEGELEQQQAMNPLERMVKTLEAKRAEAMSSPEMLNSYTQGYRGQMDLQDVAGRTAKGLEQFTTEGKRNQLTNEAAQNQLEGEYYKHLNASQDQTLPENIRIASMEKATNLRELLKNSPKFAGQKELAESKLDTSVLLKQMGIDSAEKLAQLKSLAKTGDKNAQQALVRVLNSQVETGQITPQDHMEEMAKIFSAANAAKVQPGVMVNPGVAPNVLKEKPTGGTSYTPPNSVNSTPKPPPGWSIKNP